VPYAKLDNPQSLNLYSYMLNNPLSGFDPDGHAGTCGGSDGSSCKVTMTQITQNVSFYDKNGNVSSTVKVTTDLTTISNSKTGAIVSATLRFGYQTARTGDAVSYRRFFSPNERRIVFRLAASLADRIGDETGFLLTRLGVDTEAISANLTAVLANAEAVLNLDGDSVSIVSNDRSQGLLIDRNLDDPIQSYEFAVWGNRWSLLMLASDHKQTSDSK